MAARSRRPKLVAIVGPTASGKSDLAMMIAQKYGGEIIAADSRTVYKGMNIGTAKASVEEQATVPHWGLDQVEPGERFTAHQFKKFAVSKIAEIQGRGKLPILVGGTGLYVDSVVFDFDFREDVNPKLRISLEKLDIKQLQTKIQALGYPMPTNLKNKRHLIRTVETAGRIGSKNPHPRSDMLLVGIMPPPKILKQRINARAEHIISDALVVETRQLLKNYSAETFSRTAGIAYKICQRLLRGDITKDEATELFKTNDWQYARRQKTWFKRNPYIVWFDDIKSAFGYVAKALNK